MKELKKLFGVNWKKPPTLEDLKNDLHGVVAAIVPNDLIG